jgi:hypothetical protein
VNALRKQQRPNAMSLKDCTVSIMGQDGRTYETTVEAASLFDAADRARRQWALLWWYRPGAVVVEV